MIIVIHKFPDIFLWLMAVMAKRLSNQGNGTKCPFEIRLASQRASTFKASKYHLDLGPVFQRVCLTKMFRSSL